MTTLHAQKRALQAGAGDEKVYILTDLQVGAAIHALHDYRFETERYLQSHAPSDPCCEKDAARQRVLEEQRVALNDRLANIVATLEALSRPAERPPSGKTFEDKPWWRT